MKHKKLYAEEAEKPVGKLFLYERNIGGELVTIIFSISATKIFPRKRMKIEFMDGDS